MCAWWHIRTAARELTNEPWIKFYRRTQGRLHMWLLPFCQRITNSCFFLKQPFYGDMMGISLATSVNFAVLDFQTNSYHSHGKYMAGLTLSLSLSSYRRWQVLLGSLGTYFILQVYVRRHTQTDIHMGVYQTPNTVCRRRFNMSSIWFIYGIFICANTYTCMHTRKEWRF
jgi:hypothetical protein